MLLQYQVWYLERYLEEREREREMTRSCGLPLCHYQLNGHLVENDTDPAMRFTCADGILKPYFIVIIILESFFVNVRVARTKMDSNCFYSAITKINFIYYKIKFIVCLPFKLSWLTFTNCVGFLCYWYSIIDNWGGRVYVLSGRSGIQCCWLFKSCIYPISLYLDWLVGAALATSPEKPQDIQPIYLWFIDRLQIYSKENNSNKKIYLKKQVGTNIERCTTILP